MKRIISTLISLLILSLYTKAQVYNLNDYDTISSCNNSIQLDGYHEFPHTISQISQMTGSLVNGDHTAEGFLVTLSTGEIVHFFRIDPGILGDHTTNNGRIVKRTSFDNGITWSGYQEVYNDVVYDDRNVHGGLIGQDSIVLFFRNYNAFFGEQVSLNYILSFDGGMTWTNPFHITSQYNVTFGTHKLIKVPGKGFLLAISGQYYVELRFSNDGMSWDNISYTFDYTLDLSTYISESCFEYLGNGQLIGLIRNNASNYGATYFQVISSDYGNTWTTPVSTNIAFPFFCPSPTIFYDSIHNDVWTIATDRRNYIGIFIADSSRIWVYKNKPDEIFNNPLAYHLESSWLRPQPSYYRLYGYPTYTRKADGNFLVVFTESYKKNNNLEDADFYQFNINYLNIQSPSMLYSWNTAEQTQIIEADTSGWYEVNFSDIFGSSANDSVFVDINKAKIQQNDLFVDYGNSVYISLDTSGSSLNSNYLWSNGATTTSQNYIPIGSGFLYVNIDDGLISCYDSIYINVRIDNELITDEYIKPSSIDEALALQEFKVYPNPVIDYAYFVFENKNFENLNLIINDIYGKTIVNDFTSSNYYLINREMLSSGIYSVSLYSNGNLKISTHFLVE